MLVSGHEPHVSPCFCDFLLNNWILFMCSFHDTSYILSDYVFLCSWFLVLIIYSKSVPYRTLSTCTSLAVFLCVWFVFSLLISGKVFLTEHLAHVSCCVPMCLIYFYLIDFRKSVPYRTLSTCLLLCSYVSDLFLPY